MKQLRKKNIRFLIFCLSLIFLTPLHAEKKRGSAEEPVWAVFGGDEKKEEPKKRGSAEEPVWAVFGGDKTKSTTKPAKKETSGKKSVVREKPKGPVAPPPPKLTVAKESVEQEEFLFPQSAPSPANAPAKAAKKPSDSKTPFATTALQAKDGTPVAESSSGETIANTSGPDINIDEGSYTWIPKIVRDFFTKVTEKQVVVAYEISAHLIPRIDGVADEETWLQSPTLEVPIERGPIVKVQVVYDSTNIYFLLRWNDEAPNREKNLWHFDGDKWSRKGEEDRLALMWNIDNSILDYNIHACGIACHDTEKNKQLHKMYTNSETEFADLWDWGASTSNPLGQIEDCYLDNHKFERVSGQRDIISDFIGLAISVAKGGIHYDKTDTPASIENTNADKTLPVTMIDPALMQDPLVMTAENAVLIKDYSYFEPGATIPGYLLRPLTGSRGDIKAFAKHSDGMWTLELTRKLITGNSDDIQFDITRSYYFGIAAFNNARQEKHKKSAKCLLKFKIKRVYPPALFFSLLSVSIIYLVALKKEEWEIPYRRARAKKRAMRESGADFNVNLSASLAKDEATDNEESN